MADPYDISKIVVRVAEIMINELKLEDVTPETFDPEVDLIDEVGIDSMDLATIALVLRDEYGIVIDEDDYPKLNSIRLIAEYIRERAKE
ncbi:MAG: phosphopantetheine-binding protein [Desulfobacteraceae bacterium]|nr:phosphopantetheine-binding protein [Desulfobacteraceae bacterium]MBU0733479.1 phosphopantetheine-binding protein [Pseudomonadota bacterium]MBU0989192.1 phosphopantetheine-binding protein [Pseudomonadota bacterium]